MRKSEKNKIKATEIDNNFLRVYINDFVKKFREFNTDEFVIEIKGLNKFITNNDTLLVSLIEELKQNDFIIENEGNQDSIDKIDVTCKNITKNSSFNFQYQIQNLPSIIELS